MEENCSSKACIDKPTTSLLKNNKQSSSLFKEIQMEKFYPERPLYRTEIGRISWRVFHRFSVLFSNTEEDRFHYDNFVKGVENFFPCPTCRDDFKKEISILPLKDAFSKESDVINWTCIQHNLVNKKLSKKEKDCNISTLKSEYYF